MAGLEQTVRKWLRETRLETSEAEAPQTAFAIGFKFPSGLQLTAAQPAGRPDMVVLACGLTIDAPSRAAIKERAADFVWNLRRDLLLSKLSYQMLPADAATPETVQISVELYQDGLTKTAFMRAAQEVHSGAVLVVLITRRYAEQAKD